MKLIEVRLGEVMLIEVRLGEVMLTEVRLGEVMFTEVRLGEVMFTEVRLGDVMFPEVYMHISINLQNYSCLSIYPYTVSIFLRSQRFLVIFTSSLNPALFISHLISPLLYPPDPHATSLNTITTLGTAQVTLEVREVEHLSPICPRVSQTPADGGRLVLVVVFVLEGNEIKSRISGGWRANW
ncbi:hypothetical protein Pmani_020404 [Petrolisthes manimaculis]|uniref:Uncharacterized protein n=1 Tax=Petrolisthes manimaculis TaxID=1843537 RepID=A0AAE1U330_9EUCA|nr:hypothetical protein Pmani_020404 [Petrolisthes manimaculis]